MTKQSERNNMGRGALYLTLSSFVFMLSGYLINIILGRTLGPGKYGIYAVLTSLMTAFNIMQVTGLPAAVSKFTAEDESRADAVLASGLKVQFALTSILAILLLSLSPIIAVIFRDNAFIGYVWLTAFILPLYGLFALFSGFYNGKRDFRKQSVMNIMYSFTKFVLVIGMAFFLQIYGVLIGFILAPLAALIVGWRLPRPQNHFSAKRLVRYALPLIGFSALATLQFSVDLFSVKALVGAEKLVGYYAAAQSIALIPYSAMSALGQVLFPNVARLVGAGDRVGASVAVSKSLRYLLLLLLPITALIFGSAPQIVEILFGPAYLPAVSALRALLVGYIAVTIFSLLANVLNGAGRAKSAMWLAGGGVMITLILSIVLIPSFSLVGAAFAMGMGALGSMTGVLIIARRELAYILPLRSLLRVGLASALVFALALFSVPVWILPIWWLAISCIYVVLLKMMGEINSDDRSEAISLLPSWLPVGKSNES